MYQIIQSFKTGETILETVPVPEIKRGHLLIQTTRSLVSLGTERMLVKFGRSSLLSKAQQQPEKVKQVFDKIKTDGLLTTIETVYNKLEQPLPLGYCNVGVVVSVGEGVTEFNVGDRVVSNGSHAEFVCIPKNLAALIPNDVSDEEATFTVVGAIALQGVRLLNPTLGETITVIGMGLIGMLTAQILIANGCKVVGVDVDEAKLKKAEEWGIIPFNSKTNGDVVKFIESTTNFVGCDGVIITASSKSDQIVSEAARMTRKRGRIILVGVVGLQLNRSEFYEKELSFQVSCSYGPGRYDYEYEEKGHDYPLSFVRWTEKRNFEAILHIISSRKLQVKEMISEIVDLEDYKKVYNSIEDSHNIATILKYNTKNEDNRSNCISISEYNFKASEANIAIIGAGNYTKMTLLPCLKKINANLYSIASANGLSGTTLARKYKFNFSTTNYKTILEDSNVDLIIITTQHDSHAEIAVQSLNSGKNVFVEKPLAISNSQLENVIGAYNSNQGKNSLTVGFNRRFSPHSLKVKEVLDGNPINVVATINAGFVPLDSWIHDPEVGGGRIIGEACHFVDLITFFTGSTVKSVCMNSMGLHPNETNDNATILLKYQNGSTGVINYFANGSKSYPKERIEVYSQGRMAIINNFRKTEFYGFKNQRSFSSQLDKGHKQQFEKLVLQIKNGLPPLIPFSEIVNTSKTVLLAIESLKNNSWMVVD